MKYLILIFALLSSLSAEFDWPSDYDEALQKAKVEKKDVYLFIGSAYCRYCEKMKKTTLSDKDVLKRLKKSYVTIYMSRDIDDIPSQFKTKPVPRHYFVSPKGEVIYTTIGSRSKEGFFELLDEVEESK
jgi:thioredoxin-related protein